MNTSSFNTKGTSPKTAFRKALLDKPYSDDHYCKLCNNSHCKHCDCEFCYSQEVNVDDCCRIYVTDELDSINRMGMYFWRYKGCYIDSSYNHYYYYGDIDGRYSGEYYCEELEVIFCELVLRFESYNEMTITCIDGVLHYEYHTEPVVPVVQSNGLFEYEPSDYGVWSDYEYDDLAIMEFYESRGSIWANEIPDDDTDTDSESVSDDDSESNSIEDYTEQEVKDILAALYEGFTHSTLYPNAPAY